MRTQLISVLIISRLRVEEALGSSPSSELRDKTILDYYAGRARRRRDCENATTLARTHTIAQLGRSRPFR